MSRSRETPVTLVVASLTSVILPSGLIVTSGSSEASMSERAYCDAARACSSARRRSVMSRAMDVVPASDPSRYTGDTVSETATPRPSLRIRTDSNERTGSPTRSLSRADSATATARWSWGMSIEAGWPMASAAE
jgi:hypothetical protein